MSNPINTIIHGDAYTTLKTLPDNYVQCVVTSPPYYGLRDYGIEGQIGLEETPTEYIEKLVLVFREARRVLRRDGTLWLNLGDSFAGKNLLMIPARIALALCSDGWCLRSDCIWFKPNGLPESVEDRPTKSHEYLFLLAKSERYFYDADAIREPHAYLWTEKKGGSLLGGTTWHHDANGGTNRHERKPSLPNPLGRNKRSVWTVNTQPYPEAHFATMPPKLVEPCILAGTSPMVCEHCGTPWQRIIVPTGHINKRETAHAPHSTPTKTDSTGWAHTKRATDQWQPTCKCPNNTGGGKCIVLDPFMGAGTTALVALQHNRNYLGVELNSDYIQLAQKRIAVIQPNLWSIPMESDGSVA